MTNVSAVLKRTVTRSFLSLIEETENEIHPDQAIPRLVVLLLPLLDR